MFVTELLRALLRYWYLVLCGALVAAGGAMYVWNHTEPRYTSETSVLLLPPASSIEGTAPNGDDSNPLMNLGGLNQARDVLISAMSSASQQDLFDDSFSNTVYAVGVDPLSSGPILVISTDSESESGAADGLNFLLDQFTQRLTEMQLDLAVPETSAIQSVQLTPPTTPEADTKPQLRAAAMTGVGVLVVTVLLVAAIDGLVRYVKRSKKRNHDPEPDPDDTSVAQPSAEGAVDPHASLRELGDPKPYAADDFDALSGLGSVRIDRENPAAVPEPSPR